MIKKKKKSGVSNILVSFFFSLTSPAIEGGDTVLRIQASDMLRIFLSLEPSLFVWFLCLMAYQPFISYFITKPFS